MINPYNDLLKKINTFIEIHTLLPDSATIIVGLSGGPDSVFLLHLLHQIRTPKKLTLVAAHLDHQWRKDSHKDVQFCKAIAQQLDVPFEHARYSDIADAITPSGSQEDCARQARRLFLESVHKKYNADTIALAHHTQDQQETFFIRLLRGSALTGLIGMRPRNGVYIRPLLHTSKQEILTYLHTNDISYLIDPTNQSNTFLRNRIRNHLIPTLKRCDDRFERTFSTTLTRLQETELFLEELTAQSLRTINTSQNHLVLNRFKKLHKVVRQRVLLAWLCQHAVRFTPTESFLLEIERFLAHPHGGTHRMHKTWSIKKQTGLASIVVHN